MNPTFEKLEKLGIEPLDAPENRFPAKQADIEHLQKTSGLVLPPTYAEFLLRYGMSVFNNEDWICFPVHESWDEDTDYAANDIRVFFGINKGQDFDSFSIGDLGSEIRSTRIDNLPSHFLPICESDGLSTVVYISCQQQDYGHVYALTRRQIWDCANREISTEKVCKVASHLANSFEEFVEFLEAVPL